MPRFLPLALAAVLLAPQGAKAFSVTPVRNDVKLGGATTITVNNADSTKPLTYEASIIKRVLGEDGMTQEQPTEDDFVIVPPAGIVPPGSTQAIRVQYVGEGGTEKSQHYFLNVREIPVETENDAPPPTTGVRAKINIAFAYNVAVNVVPPGAKPEVRLISTTGGKTAKAGDKIVPAIEIIAENKGPAHAYLDDYRLSVTGKNGVDISYEGEKLQAVTSTPLLPGMMTRRFLLPVEAGQFPNGVLKAELR